MIVRQRKKRVLGADRKGKRQLFSIILQIDIKITRLTVPSQIPV